MTILLMLSMGLSSKTPLALFLLALFAASNVVNGKNSYFSIKSAHTIFIVSKPRDCIYKQGRLIMF